MFLQTKMLFLFTETPLHAGAGSGLGTVDLPIQRERATGYPVVQASGIKGALRSQAQGSSNEILAVFGPDTENVTHAGALSTGDARLLLFPVRSLTGIFAWTTSLHVLTRFARDLSHAGLCLPSSLPDTEPEPDAAYVSGGGVLPRGGTQTVVLEEFSFSKADDDRANHRTTKLAEWLAENAFPQADAYAYWREKVQSSLVILPNDAFRDFALNATEVLTRIRLEPDSKTVARGALWSEEHLPSDCLLYSPVRATRIRQSDPKNIESLQDDEAQKEAAKVLEWAANSEHIPHWIQLGGDETVGRGIVQLRWTGGNNG